MYSHTLVLFNPIAILMIRVYGINNGKIIILFYDYYYIYLHIYNTKRNKQKQSARPEIANNKIEIDQSRKILSSKNLYTWP